MQRSRVDWVVIALALAAAARAEAACDTGLALSDVDPIHGAAAIELCDLSLEGSPGLVGASYGSADLATPLAQLTNGNVGVGLLAAFGPNVPVRGARMLALSSGTARSPIDPGFTDPGAGFAKGYTSGYPTGLPYEIPSCPGVTTGAANDSVALRLVLRVPSFAHSLSFSFKFHTTDFPDFTCSAFNDWFFATLDPAPPSGPNVAFDAQGNPITVNSVELIGVCEAQAAGGTSYPCPFGTAELVGTGFESHAATPWLTTRAPVTPDTQITLDLGIFDAGDGALDATVLLDDFRWSAATIESPVTTVPEPGALAGALAALAALGLVGGRRP